MIDVSKQPRDLIIQEHEKNVLTLANLLIKELIKTGYVPQGTTSVTLHLNQGRVERRQQIGFQGHA